MKSPASLLLSVMIALGLIAACPAAGQNQFGLFFDTYGEFNCGSASFLSHTNMFLLYLGPIPPQISGCELGIEAVLLGNPPEALDSQFALYGATGGLLGDGSLDQIAILWDPPLPCTSVTHLMTIDIFYLDFTPLYFAITGPAEPSQYLAGPFVLLPDGSSLQVDVDVPYPPDWSAVLFERSSSEFCHPLADDSTAWGALKCLYRN